MFVGYMFVFPFVLEKRPIQRVEGCVTQISEIRKKSENWYFDNWYFDTPDKHKRLQTFSKELMSCVITKIIWGKEAEFWLTKFSTIKTKTDVFAKQEQQKINSMEQILYEIDPMEIVSVKVKVLLIADQKTVDFLKLREYIASDDDESFINKKSWDDQALCLGYVDPKHNAEDCKMHCLQPHTVSIFMSSRFIAKINHSKKSYWCNAEILKPNLPKDLIIGQNEEFLCTCCWMF